VRPPGVPASPWRPLLDALGESQGANKRLNNSAGSAQNHVMRLLLLLPTEVPGDPHGGNDAPCQEHNNGGGIEIGRHGGEAECRR
jgi:hypothetical protein